MLALADVALDLALTEQQQEEQRRTARADHLRYSDHEQSVAVLFLEKALAPPRPGFVSSRAYCTCTLYAVVNQRNFTLSFCASPYYTIQPRFQLSEVKRIFVHNASYLS